MGLLDGTTQHEYYEGDDHGNYQFTSLENIITQFEIAYVGEGKIIPRTKRADIAFHAQRAMQELSFDTFKSCKAQEITLPATLQMTLPQDYVNYTKISWVDDAGIKHPLYPTNRTSNPPDPYQDSDGGFTLSVTAAFPGSILGGPGGSSFLADIVDYSLLGTLNGGQRPLSSMLHVGMECHWEGDSTKYFLSSIQHRPGPQGESDADLLALVGVPTYMDEAYSNTIIMLKDIDGNLYNSPSGAGVNAAQRKLIFVGDLLKNYSNTTIIRGFSYVAGNPFFTLPSETLDNLGNGLASQGESYIFHYNELIAKVKPGMIISASIGGDTSVYNLFVEGFGVVQSVDDINTYGANTTFPTTTANPLVWFENNFTQTVDPFGINPGTPGLITSSEIALTFSNGPIDDSQTWSNYKSGTPSENQNQYDDGSYWPAEGSRFGLDPQHAQANGSFYIDCHSGKIHFSSNISGKTVILDYISDSLGTDEEMQVHKFAEEAMYKCIAYAILSTSSSQIHQQLVPRFKKEKFAATRQAKLRLSNIKLEELTQILRGKSKQIKH